MPRWHQKQSKVRVNLHTIKHGHKTRGTQTHTKPDEAFNKYDGLAGHPVNNELCGEPTGVGVFCLRSFHTFLKSRERQ